jgi:hypothetical protein
MHASPFPGKSANVWRGFAERKKEIEAKNDFKVQIADQILVLLNFCRKSEGLELAERDSFAYKFYILVSLA